MVWEFLTVHFRDLETLKIFEVMAFDVNKKFYIYKGEESLMLVHTDPGKGPKTENLPLWVEEGEKPKKEAGHSSLVINRITYESYLGWLQAGMDSCATWQVPEGSSRGIFTDISTWMLSGTEITLTRSGQQPVPEPVHSQRQGRVLIYVRMNLNYN